MILIKFSLTLLRSHYVTINTYWKMNDSFISRVHGVKVHLEHN